MSIVYAIGARLRAATLLGSLALLTANCSDAATVVHLRFDNDGKAVGATPTGAANEISDQATSHPGTFMGTAGASNWTDEVPALQIYDPISDTLLANTHAFRFGSDSRIDLAFSNLLPSATSLTAFTFEAFVLGTPGAGGQLFEHRSDSAVSGPDVFFFPDGTMQLRLSGEPGQNFANATGQLNDGNWHHVATVYNSATGTLTAFIDGAEAGSVAAPGAWTEGLTQGNFSIGSFLAGPHNFNNFAGVMDEIRISNVALTPDQFLQAVPEPSAMVLLVGGLVGLAVVRQRRTR